MHINSECSASAYWFIRHRRDFGSKRVVYTIAILYYLIEALALFSMECINNKYMNLADLGLWFIEFIVLIVIWRIIPTFYDVFGIKRELQLIIRAGGIALLVYVPYNVQVLLVGHDNLWFFMFCHLIFGVMVGICGLILNGYVFYKYFEMLPIEENIQKIAVIDNNGKNIQTKCNRMSVPSKNKRGRTSSHSGTASGNQLDVSRSGLFLFMNYS